MRDFGIQTCHQTPRVDALIHVKIAGDIRARLRQLREKGQRVLVVIWIVRLLLLAAGSIAALFVARDASNFGIIQMLVAMVMILVFVGGVEWWMQRWKM